MKLKYFLTIGGLALGSFAQAQTNGWIADTVHMQAGYADNVYYSMENGTVKTAPEDSWDLAFRTQLMTVGVYANHVGNGVAVFPFTGKSGAADFGQDLTTDTVGLTGDDFALYNSVTSWDTGAFNQNRDASNIFDLGWGTYDPSSHLVAGDKIYLVLTNTGAYQLWIESDDPFGAANPPEWKFHICNLDGTNQKVKTFHPDPDYTHKLFAYYNIENDTFLNIDPDQNDWDLIFTRYKELVSMGPFSMMYPVTGALSNEHRKVVEIRGTDAVDTTWSAAMAANFDSAINAIGRDWKLQPDSTGHYQLDTVTYFVAVPSGDIWQLEFTYATVGNTTGFPGLTPGEIGLRKRKVVDTTNSIATVNPEFSKILLAPNPAKNLVHLVIEAKKPVSNTQITITDLSGRTLQTMTKSLTKGLQHFPVDVASFAPGVYFITITAEGVQATRKLIVQ